MLCVLVCRKKKVGSSLASPKKATGPEECRGVDLVHIAPVSCDQPVARVPEYKLGVSDALGVGLTEVHQPGRFPVQAPPAPLTAHSRRSETGHPPACLGQPAVAAQPFKAPALSGRRTTSWKYPLRQLGGCRGFPLEVLPRDRHDPAVSHTDEIPRLWRRYGGSWLARLVHVAPPLRRDGVPGVLVTDQPRSGVPEGWG